MINTVALEIFSPRWGHHDIYSVELGQDYMEVSMQMRSARAQWHDALDPTWTGEAIDNMMRIDSIYPPGITRDLFEQVWKAWRTGEISDQKADAELQEVANWINAVTAAQPKTDFWRRYF
jgi:hypothetical protein